MISTRRMLLIRAESRERHAQETCERKQRYADEFAARAQGTHEMESGQVGAQLYVYRCGVCRRWHLTKTRQDGPESRADFYLKEATE